VLKQPSAAEITKPGCFTGLAFSRRVYSQAAKSSRGGNCDSWVIHPKSMIRLNQRAADIIHELLRLFAHENLLSEAEYEPAGQALFNYFCNLMISSNQSARR
jgi:hypothetical protein